MDRREPSYNDRQSSLALLHVSSAAPRFFGKKQKFTRTNRALPPSSLPRAPRRHRSGCPSLPWRFGVSHRFSLAWSSPHCSPCSGPRPCHSRTTSGTRSRARSGTTIRVREERRDDEALGFQDTRPGRGKTRRYARRRVARLVWRARTPRSEPTRTPREVSRHHPGDRALVRSRCCPRAPRWRAALATGRSDAAKGSGTRLGMHRQTILRRTGPRLRTTNARRGRRRRARRTSSFSCTASAARPRTCRVWSAAS